MKNRSRTTVLALGEHRGQPRLDMEGRWLIDAGVAPGRSNVIRYVRPRIEITRADDGRSVIGKPNGAHAVIDLNGSSPRDCLGAIDRVTVRADAGRITFNPVVQTLDPRRRDHHRWPTPDEVRRLAGLPEGWNPDAAKPTAGEPLGEGVQVERSPRLLASVARISKEAGHGR